MTMRERVARAWWEIEHPRDMFRSVEELDQRTQERVRALTDAAIRATINYLMEQSTQPDYRNTDQEEWLSQFLPRDTDATT